MGIHPKVITSKEDMILIVLGRGRESFKSLKKKTKSITIQTYDGFYGAIDKVLSFIQQFDAAFGGEDFTESSKLRHVAMHFTKAARQWWASLKTQDTHPRPWKLCRAAIMKQFLTEDAKNKVLTAWRGLKLEKGKSIQQYINKFWDLHLKATVFKKRDFAEQRQQYCAILTEDIRTYVNDQKPRTIAEVIHRSKVAMENFPISKGAPKPFERNEKVHGREQVSKDSKGNGSKGKKDKVPYKGPRKLSPEEMERYKKENRCYKCGEIGHISHACPKRQQRAPRFHRLAAVLEDCFADEIPNDLSPLHGEDDHKIELIPGSSPPNRPPYRVSYAQQEEIVTQVNELLEKGLVRPSSSPFCSSVLLVQKKDGSYRMCIDYRALNKQTIKNRFPVPRIEDIFDRLQGSTYYSRIDLKSGYHQIRIVPEDIHKTAFRTQFGLYEYVVMPFGLTNAPATFNRLMENIFCKHSAYTGVFFDDIIVHSHTLEEHKKHLQSVFDELRANRLFVNGKKSEFFMKEIKYLGHIISKEGIRMDPEKLKVIDEWPEPCNVHELRSFLGMYSYYRRFIRDFSRIAGPLHDLTKKKAKYVWTPKENTAFMQLKAKLMTQPLLVLLDLKKPFEVHCDACGDSIGAVLSQEGHAIAYESRRLNSQERGLGVYEKELISVIHALQSWKHYLLGTAFVIYTDHQSIRYFMTQTKLSEKQMRWANFLYQFHFHIAHVTERKIK
ncbi:hypothetical protein L7F22_029329 [Adiantum nelumboides]|nr:hypothetical protein [Adiantum nelumboides]